MCYCFYTNCNHKVAPPHIIIVNTIIIGSNYPHNFEFKKSINHGDFVQLNVPLMETNHGSMSYTWTYNKRHSHSVESLKSRNPREMPDMAVSKTKNKHRNVMSRLTINVNASTRGNNFTPPISQISELTIHCVNIDTKCSCDWKKSQYVFHQCQIIG